MRRRPSAVTVSAVPDSESAAARLEVTSEDATEILRINADAPLDALQVAFGGTAVLAAALFFTGRIPRCPPGGPPDSGQAPVECPGHAAP